MSTFIQINEATGFTNGELFGTPDEVREYFKVANLKKKGFNPIDQKFLDDCAREVIVHGWHMEPFRATVLEKGTRVSFGGALDEIWHYLQGFRSSDACMVIRQSVRAESGAPGQKPGDRLYSGTVRQVMEWIEDAVKQENVEPWTGPGKPTLASVHPWNGLAPSKSESPPASPLHVPTARSA